MALEPRSSHCSRPAPPTRADGETCISDFLTLASWSGPGATWRDLARPGPPWLARSRPTPPSPANLCAILHPSPGQDRPPRSLGSSVICPRPARRGLLRDPLALVGRFEECRPLGSRLYHSRNQVRSIKICSYTPAAPLPGPGAVSSCESRAWMGWDRLLLGAPLRFLTRLPCLSSLTTSACHRLCGPFLSAAVMGTGRQTLFAVVRLSCGPRTSHSPCRSMGHTVEGWNACLVQNNRICWGVTPPLRDIR